MSEPIFCLLPAELTHRVVKVKQLSSGPDTLSLHVGLTERKNILFNPKIVCLLCFVLCRLMFTIMVILGRIDRLL